MSISLEDAARVATSRMAELVRYGEQSNPQALQHVMVVLAGDAATMAAVGASIAVVIMRYLAKHQVLPGQSA